MQGPVGRLDVTAFDCPDPVALADFYRAIVGGELVPHSQGAWVELHTPEGKLAFQRIDDHRPPTWPRGEVPQQAHIDVDVDDLDVAERAVVQLGAVKADTQPAPENFRVFFDPAGHPFCVVRPWPESRDAEGTAPDRSLAVVPSAPCSAPRWSRGPTARDRGRTVARADGRARRATIAGGGIAGTLPR